MDTAPNHSDGQPVRRGWLRALAIPVGLLFASAHLGIAEILPSKGTFKGIYHVNRAGVGRFSCFVVPQGLRNEMAPYEQKYIKVEVVKAEQPMNPGDSVIQKLGRITLLPEPAVKIKLRTVATGEGTGGGFDAIYEFTNTGSDDVVIDAKETSAGILGYTNTGANDLNYFLSTASGYTSRQLLFGNTNYSACQRWRFLSSTAAGERTHFHMGGIQLSAGESVPFLIGNIHLDQGGYEFVAKGILRLNGQTMIPLSASMPIDWPLQNPVAKPANSLHVQSQVSRDDEWLVVKAALFPVDGPEASIFTRGQGSECFLSGLLQLTSPEGHVIPSEIQWNEPDGLWHRTRVSQTGVPFSFRVRPSDLFSRDKVTGITFLTVTERGVEKLTVSDSVPERKTEPLPEWGLNVDGCQLRINIANREFATDRPLRLFFQIRSDGSTADILWINKNNLEPRVHATIDGVPCRIITTGLSDEHVYKFPFQGEITLESLRHLPAGEHTLTLSLTGDSGNYTNLRNENFRKLGATLISNTVRFKVAPD